MNILKEIFAALVFRFNATTVEQALTALNKYIDKLQAIANANLRIASEAALAAKEAHATQLLAQAESDRAKKAADKIKDLISGA